MDQEKLDKILLSLVSELMDLGDEMCVLLHKETSLLPFQRYIYRFK